MTTETATQPDTEKPKKKKKSRRKRYQLFEITTIEGTDHPAWVPLDMEPLGLPEDKANREAEIKKAVAKAVYEDGLAEFGNKTLIAVPVGEPFRCDFVESRKLVPPSEGASEA